MADLVPLGSRLSQTTGFPSFLRLSNSSWHGEIPYDVHINNHSIFLHSLVHIYYTFYTYAVSLPFPTQYSGFLDVNMKYNYAYSLLHSKYLPLAFRHANIVGALATFPANVIKYPMKTAQVWMVNCTLSPSVQWSQDIWSNVIHNQ